MEHQGAPSVISQSAAQPTEVDPLSFVLCSSCRRSYEAAEGPAFSLTTCSHTVCDACTFPGQQPPKIVVNLQVECPACSTTGPILRLAEGGDLEGLAPCFRPLSTLLDELGMAVRWQVGNIAEQLAFFKRKCAEQRTTLGKLGGELKKMKTLKSQVEQLTAENTFLRDQLAAIPQHHHEAPRHPSARLYNSDPGSFGAVMGGAESPKRSADGSPPRENSIRQAPQNARSTSAAARDLPVQPARLSLTPAHARDHSARRQQTDAQRTDPAGDGAGGRASRMAGPGDQRAVRQKLADYAYDPTRAHDPASRHQQRTFGEPPRPPSSSRPSSSSRNFAPAAQQEQQYYQQPDAPRFQSPHLGSVPPHGQSYFQPSPRQQQQQQQQQNVRTSFAPPPRGITPMPTSSRFGPVQMAQSYAPPTPQRQPFQPLPPQGFDPRSAGHSSTPRPGSSSSFSYRDPGGFVQASHMMR